MVDRTPLPAFEFVSATDIAKRAHERFVDRLYPDGFDREDWLRAEHELKNPTVASVSARRDDADKSVEQTIVHATDNAASDSLPICSAAR